MTMTHAAATNEPTNPLIEVTRHIMSERLASQLKMALPEHISVEKFQRVVITAINKNADLVSADLLSLLTASVECAQDGLLPDGKEAALVIYNTKVPNVKPDRWIKKVQYMPMIKGICKLAHNSGELPFLDMHVVHENDEFDYELGLHPHLIHKPKLGERGSLIGAYAVARTSQGTEYIEVMSYDEIEGVRLESSKSKDKKTGDPYGPWKNYYGEMARKTVLRRLSKRLPLSSGLSRVIERIDAMHTFENQAGAIEADAPTRPKLEDFTQKEAVELLTLINEFGEPIGEFSKPEYVTRAVDQLDAFQNRDHLDAFMEFNDETFEGLGTRTDERQDIARAYNAARDRCPVKNTNQESTTDQGEDWQAWSDNFLQNIATMPDESAINKLMADKKDNLDDLEVVAPKLFQNILDAINVRQAELAPSQDEG